MSKGTAIGTGDLIDLFDEGGLVCAVVLGEEKGRLKVVTESGRQLAVTASRVAHRAGRAPAGSPQAAAAAALEHGRSVLERLGEIDITALWDVLVDEPKRYTLGSLASLALGEDAPVARSAMLRALQQDRACFTRKGDDFEPRSREYVEQTRKREAAERARAERRAAFLERARAALAGNPADPAGLFEPQHRDTIADLVEVAIMGDEAESRRKAVSLLDDLRVPEGSAGERAFRLLVALGLFHRDENLLIHRFRLRTSFSEEVERQAALAARREASLQGRRDLRGLCAFTIDDDLTTEVDDALSLEMLDAMDRTIRLGIHIADPGSYVQAGDAVDLEAMSRAATFYFPEVKLPMMPAAVAEGAASLAEGADRPALSFLVTLSPMGEVVGSEIVSSLIRSRARLTYEQADALMEGSGETREGGDARSVGVLEDPRLRDQIAAALKRLRPLCEALEAERVAAGAVVIRAAEVDIKVRPGGDITIRRIDERGAARRMVSEAMVLANRLAAEFCMRRGIPAIYRRQAAPQEAAFPREPAAAAAGVPGAASAGLARDAVIPGLEAVEAGGYDPVAVRALRRRMRRGEVSLVPAPHHGLGLPAYLQATSPIRRYQDLVVHRQIKAALLGSPLPYDAEALARIAAATDDAERAAREAERGTDEYWILRYYESRMGQEVEGVVVAADPRRTEVELTDTLYNVNLASRPDHRLGLRLRLGIEAVRPRAGKLILREIAP